MSQLSIEKENEPFDYKKYVDFAFIKDYEEKHVLDIVVYDPKIAEFQEMLNHPITLGLALLPEDLKKPLEAERPTDKESAELVYTGIIEDLNSVTIEAKLDRKAVHNPPITDEPSVRQSFEDNRDDYNASRLYYYAEEICQHIDGLIQLDKYPEHMFGQYKRIRKFLFREKNPIVADRLLGQLIILGRSSVPAKIRYEESESVEPTITSMTRTIEQS